MWISPKCWVGYTQASVPHYRDEWVWGDFEDGKSPNKQEGFEDSFGGIKNRQEGRNTTKNSSQKLTSQIAFFRNIQLLDKTEDFVNKTLLLQLFHHLGP